MPLFSLKPRKEIPDSRLNNAENYLAPVLVAQEKTEDEQAAEQSEAGRQFMSQLSEARSLTDIYTALGSWYDLESQGAGLSFSTIEQGKMILPGVFSRLTSVRDAIKTLGSLMENYRRGEFGKFANQISMGEAHDSIMEDIKFRVFQNPRFVSVLREIYECLARIPLTYGLRPSIARLCGVMMEDDGSVADQFGDAGVKTIMHIVDQFVGSQSGESCLEVKTD